MRQRPGEPQGSPPSRQSSSIIGTEHNPPKKPPRAASFMPRIAMHRVMRGGTPFRQRKLFERTLYKGDSIEAMDRRQPCPQRFSRLSWELKNKIMVRIATFFRLGIVSSSLIAARAVKTAGKHLCSSPFTRSRGQKRIPNRKKLQRSQIFCFCNRLIAPARQTPQKTHDGATNRSRSATTPHAKQKKDCTMCNPF